MLESIIGSEEKYQLAICDHACVQYVDLISDSISFLSAREGDISMKTIENIY